MKLLRTSTFQLTVLYAVILAISTMSVGIFLYWSTIGFLQRQTDQAIEIEITGLGDTYRSRGLNGLTRVIGERIRSGEDEGAIYLFADSRLRPLAGNLDEWPDLVSAEDGWYSFAVQRNDVRMNARARVVGLREGLVLLVGRDISDLNRLLGLVGSALLWSAALVIALSMIGGIFMSRRVLRRLESVNDVSRGIVAGDFSRRFENRGTQDEFDELSNNLNHMLDRIEQLMADVRHAGDNIAHDLRTPLTRMRHTLESASQLDDATDMRESVSKAIDDADRLLETFSALLRIGRLESGGYQLRRETLDLSELVNDALDLYEVVAEEKHITIETNLESPGHITGDRDLVFQLIANLLDNAIKYTPEAGAIRISVERSAKATELKIVDSGPGVPDEELDRITRRFYRVDGSRRLPGSGLGLSLVQAVATHHGAELTLANGSPGFSVGIAFPLQR